MARTQPGSENQLIKIPDINEEIVSKAVIKKAIREHHHKQMKEEMQKLKKLDPIKHEQFLEVQEYCNEKSIHYSNLK